MYCKEIEGKILKIQQIKKNLKVDIEITEQISGTVPFKRRPQGYELWKSLKNNDQIICSHLDRFSRNTLDLLTLVEVYFKKFMTCR